MQFSKLALFTITALLSTTGEACKCFGTDGKHNKGATHKCCDDYHGVFTGIDCMAGSISEHLRGFDKCCKGQGSDCDYPRHAEAESETEGMKKAVKHVAIKTVLAQ